MNKLFRPKCLRRVLLCLALLFPIVYLCGGLFFALTGAHGNNNFEGTTGIVGYNEYDFNQLAYFPPSSNDDLIYTNIVNKVIDDDSLTIITPAGVTNPQINLRNLKGGHKYVFRYQVQTSYTTSSLNDNGSLLIRFFNSSNILLDSFYQNPNGSYVVERNFNVNFGFNITFNISPGFSTSSTEMIIKLNVFDLTQIYGAGNEKTYDNFILDFPKEYYQYTLSELIKLPIYGEMTFSQYLFSQPFANNNFISTLGKDLVNGSTKGFNPMNELFRSINSNIMHFEVTDSLAMFGLGYVYYAVNVLIIYEILILAVKLIMLPLKAVDLFDKKEDI